MIDFHCAGGSDLETSRRRSDLPCFGNRPRASDQSRVPQRSRCVSDMIEDRGPVNTLPAAHGGIGARVRDGSLPFNAEIVRPTATSFPAAESFVVMVAAFYRQGGLVTSDELLPRLRRHCDQPISRLARWIVKREIVSFSWQSQTLVPMFQFDLFRMSLLPGPRRVTQELVGAFDDWDVASWYSQPNSWLAGDAPIDCVAACCDSVLAAARVDRFIAAG